MRVRILYSAHNDMLDDYWFYEKHFGFYRALSRRFPYSIYCDIEDGEARIYGMLDNRRDPNWIYGHLQTARASES